MNIRGIRRLAAVWVLGLALAASAFGADPEAEIVGVSVSGAGAQTMVNVSFRYRHADGGRLFFRLEASSDNAATWDQVPVVTLSGDTSGDAVSSWRTGTLRWAAGVDWPDQVSAQMWYRLVVEGGAAPPVGGYLVVDVSAGPDASSYPVTELDQAPPDLLTNIAYKTTRIVLRRIPAGAYTRGSPPDELGRWDDERQHQVTLTQDFYMGVFQVTQAQYQNVTGEDPSSYKGAARPVEQVSWNDARGGTWPGDPPGSGQPASGTFVARLRARTGLAFDLPTEAQWEYACRAGTTTSLNSGKNITTTSGTCPNLNEVGRYWQNGGSPSQHAVVGSYQPSAWGLYDMHGNVWEWCLDWHGTYPTGPVTDPLGPGSANYRVLRGGSWITNPLNCRSAVRFWYSPDFRFNYGIGFRLSCPAQE